MADNAYSGIDYPIGTALTLDAVRVRVQVVGRNGNYLVRTDDGVQHQAHHSQLRPVPCLFDDGGTYCYAHDTFDDHPLVVVPAVAR